MKLLIEEVVNTQCIVEDVGGSKNYFITGPFMQAEVKNKNGRLYPKNILGHNRKYRVTILLCLSYFYLIIKRELYNHKLG